MEWERKSWMEELEAGESISGIARRHQISRKALYKWIARYQELGSEGLEDRSRAPRRPAHQVGEIWRERIRGVRQQHPQWGPYKLQPVLQKHYAGEAVPSASTIQRMLREMGLSRSRRRIPRAKGTGRLWNAQEPNEVWAIDFKGWCRTGDGRRCEPLTLLDQASRYLLCCQGLDSTRTELVRPVLENVFREYGLPERIRSDNGAPFGSNGGCGLTELSVWWIELGVECERIRPGHPQQNGRQERMHRTLKEATMQTPAATLRKQQARFDTFCREYNEERAHEGLGLATPAEVYRPSRRSYPERIAKPEYEAGWEVRKGGRWRSDSLVLRPPVCEPCPDRKIRRLGTGRRRVVARLVSSALVGDLGAAAAEAVEAGRNPLIADEPDDSKCCSELTKGNQLSSLQAARRTPGVAERCSRTRVRFAALTRALVRSASFCLPPIATGGSEGNSTHTSFEML